MFSSGAATSEIPPKWFQHVGSTIEITIDLQVTLGFSQFVVHKKPNFCQYTVRTLDVQILTLNVKNMVQNDCLSF